jgi:hypothetical protein
MSIVKILAVLIALLLAGCAPAAPAGAPTATAPPPTAIPPATTAPPAPTATPAPQQPTGTPLPAQEETPTAAATLSEWEQAQQAISSFRNRLERTSDGYNGLSEALEQSEANAVWCGGLDAAIGDFTYVGDTESAQALEELKLAQGCP